MDCQNRGYFLVNRMVDLEGRQTRTILVLGSDSRESVTVYPTRYGRRGCVSTVPEFIWEHNIGQESVAGGICVMYCRNAATLF
jgi:hypothetical protein